MESQFQVYSDTSLDIPAIPAESPAANPAAQLNLARIAWRAFEIVFAATVLILTMPVMLFIGVLIKLGTPGPALFFQERVGKGGKTFKFVKFRTMYVDARQRFPELYKYSYQENDIKSLVFKIKDDPRLSPQGRWLRKTSLDELPNFWNVLTGDMALVGPRPEIPQMVKYYPGEYSRKFEVRPGVSGLAQVSGRGNLSFMETAELDLKYVKEQSLSLDIKVLFKSFQAVLFGTGAF